VRAGFSVNSCSNAIYTLMKLGESLSTGETKSGSTSGPLRHAVGVFVRNLRKRQPFPLTEINFVQAHIKGYGNGSMDGWVLRQVMAQRLSRLACALCRAAPQPLYWRSAWSHQTLCQLLGLLNSDGTEGNIAASNVAPVPLRTYDRVSDQGYLFCHKSCFHPFTGVETKKSP